MNLKLRVAMSAVLMALLAACAGTPPLGENAALTDAVKTVSSASQDQNVEKYAPVELQKAKDTLNKAELVWRNTGDQARTDHLAYLAKRHAETAQAKGAEGVAQAQTSAAKKESQNMVLQSRQSEIQELREKLSALKPRQTARGIVLTIGNVLFAFDSANLSAAAQEPLGKLADFLQAHPDDGVRIEGYTDNVGSDAYNQRLSEQRAQSVATAMIQRGVDPTRMTVVGYGEANPVAPNTTKYGRQQNRRVDFVILNAGGQPGGGTAAPGTTMPPSTPAPPTVILPSGSGT